MIARERSRLLLAVTAVTFLLFFRAPMAFKVDRLDESCYVEWLYRFIGAPPAISCAAVPNYYMPGAAILWIPVGVAARLLSWLTGIEVHEWLHPLLGLFSFACLAASLMVVDRICRLAGEERDFPPLWSSAFVLGTPLLVFVTQKPFFAHSAELLLASLSAYLMLTKRYVWSAIFALWLVGTRVNDALFLLLPLTTALDRILTARPGESLVGEKRLLALASVSCALASIPLARMAFVTGYGGTSFLPTLIGVVTLKDLVKLLVGYHNAMLWMQPWWLLLLGLGIWNVRRVSWRARAVLLWMVLQAWICAGWAPTSLYFLDRYLVGTYVGALLLWLELRPMVSSRTIRILNGLLIWQLVARASLSWVANTRFQGGAALMHPLASLQNAFQSLQLMITTPPGIIVFHWLHGVIDPSGERSAFVLSGLPFWILVLATLAALGGLCLFVGKIAGARGSKRAVSAGMALVE